LSASHLRCLCHYFWFVYLNNNWRWINVMKLPTVQFYPVTCNFPLIPNVSFNPLFSQSVFVSNCKRPSFALV
jgi:hypothetical protein